MKRKALCALIALALVGGTAVGARAGFRQLVHRAAHRCGLLRQQPHTDTSLWGGIGVGVWVNPHLAVDFEYTHQQCRLQGQLLAQRPVLWPRHQQSGKASALGVPAAGSSATKARSGVRT